MLRVVSLGLVLALVACTQPMTQVIDGIAFTELLTTETEIPGGFGTFTAVIGNHSAGPAIDGDRVVTNAEGQLGQKGIYSIQDGRVERIVDLGMLPNNPDFRFLDFGPPAVSGSRIAFTAYEMYLAGGAYKGPWLYDDGELTRLVDYDQPMPGREASFDEISFNYTIDGDRIMICGVGTDGFPSMLVVEADGSLSDVVDGNDSIPGGTGTFIGFHVTNPFTGSSLSQYDLSGENTVFTGEGSDGQLGVYRSIAGQIQLVADRRTPIPGGDGAFENFGSVVIDGEVVVFVGFGSDGQTGIYRFGAEGLTTVAAAGDPFPGGTGTFSGFGFFHGPAIDGERVAFLANGEGGQLGLFLAGEEGVRKVVARGDELFGKPLVQFGPYLSAGGLDGDALAFQVLFDDASQGLYLAAIP